MSLSPRVMSAALVLALAAAVMAIAPQPVAHGQAPDRGAPDWAHDAVIYQVFVDRFDNGDPSNDDPIEDQEDGRELIGWMGGDLQGVLDRLGHLEDLGVNALWLTPVTPGPYSHGYHAVDYLDVDPRFGDLDLLRDVIDDANDRGIRVIADLVLNHTSDQHPWFVDAQSDCANSPFVDWYDFTSCPDDYRSFFGIAELPELDLSHPPALAHMTDVVVPFYLDDLGFDGLRLDYVKGQDLATWGAIADAAADVDPDAWVFGEVFDGDRAVIAPFEGVLGGAFDFPLHYALTDTFARGAGVQRVDQAIHATAETFGDDFVLPTFLDNHDVERFIHAAGDDVDAALRAATTQLTIPGPPTIYYGNEIGLSQSGSGELPEGGWADRWYREPMPWDPAEWETDLLARYTDLIGLRTTTPALSRGEYATVDGSGDRLAYERRLGDDRLLVVVDTAASATASLAELYESSIPDGVVLTDLLTGAEHTAAGGDALLDLDQAGSGVFSVAGDLPEPPGPPDTGAPSAAHVAGSFQSELGCGGDWIPDCDATEMGYTLSDDAFVVSLDLPAGQWEYKVTIDGSWDVSYGPPGGGNFFLDLPEARRVTFFLDWRTPYVADDVNHRIVTAPGNYQGRIGCSGDWQPECLRSWLLDTTGDGVFERTVRLRAGDYEVKAAINRSWSENYGLDGVRDGPNIPFSVTSDDDPVTFRFESATNTLTVDGSGDGPPPNLGAQRAHWLDARTIGVPVPAGDGTTFTLHSSPDAGLGIVDGAVVGGHETPLQPTTREPGFFAPFPHLSSLQLLEVPTELDAAAVLTGQLAVSATDGTGDLVLATGVQIPGVLDDLFATEEPLGTTWDGDVPSLHLWAPTAQDVALHRFEGPDGPLLERVPATRQPDGRWSVTGAPGWDRSYALWEVTVFTPSTQAVEVNLVTDPYSLSLAADSTRTQIVRLSDGDLAPPGWGGPPPALGSMDDAIVYELHVRDFSAGDPTVPEDLVGTFAAFTLDDTAGVNHLRDLATAGLTHLHLLPVFDITTVPERRGDQQTPAIEHPITDPASTQPQAAVAAVADTDAFNWGYDPWHFTVPEGSYATDPDGTPRITEFREMVAALHDLGLRVVVDVVYNHTSAAGQDERSVLDRIVPGYYQRLDAAGSVETSSCCPNTASEHAMMGRLVIDSVRTWAVDYRVDGFRFDLMGHHPRDLMLDLRAELDGLTVADDGIDGESILLYGEGWNFGEVANDARFVQATQSNMAGTGIGTFNDRLRDGARGGNPFGGLREQGLVTGLGVEPNGTDQGSAEEVAARACHLTDLVRIGIAGNLADYAFETCSGEVRTGADLDYGGSPAGYAEVPLDNVVYVSKHDNETLFDAIQYKVPAELDIADRARIQHLGLAVVALSQGLPFFHAGSDLLRSKSLDRDSYNSGDHFNAIDWTGATSRWGVGLPPAEKNEQSWNVMRPILRERPAPTSEAMLATAAGFRELLMVRRSSELFALPTAEAIADQLHFLGTGPDAVPGVVSFHLSGGTDAWTDVVVVLNTRPEAIEVDRADLPAGGWALHPVLANSTDPVVRTAGVTAGTFAVPGRTAAVFVLAADEPGGGGTPPWAPGPPPWAPGPPERPGPPSRPGPPWMR